MLLLKRWKIKGQEFSKNSELNGSFESYVGNLHYPKERSVLETKLMVRISLVSINKLQVLEDVLITSEDKN